MIFLRHNIFRIENRRGIVQGRDEDAVEVKHIPEVDRSSGQKEADARGKNQQQGQGNKAENGVPVEGSPCVNHDGQKSGKGECQVHGARQYAGNGEEILWNVYLFDERAVFKNRSHGEVRGFRVETEKHLSAEQIQDVVVDVEAEQRGEHHGRNNHHQQRIQDAPQDSEDAASVFFLDITNDKFADKIAVFDYLQCHGLLLWWMAGRPGLGSCPAFRDNSTDRSAASV